MSPLLWEQCLATEVLVLTGVGRRHREAIIALSGSTSSYYLTHLTQVGVANVFVCVWAIILSALIGSHRDSGCEAGGRWVDNTNIFQ